MLWPRAHSALLKVRPMTWNINHGELVVKYNHDYTMAFDTWLSATKSTTLMTYQIESFSSK